MPLPPDDTPIDRRRFFREGLRGLMRPLGSTIGRFQHVAKQLEALSDPFAPAPPPPAIRPQRAAGAIPRGAAPDAPQTKSSGNRAWQRPPGALPELEFTQACTACGKCVEVCPAQCIKLDPEKKLGKGVAYIDVDEMPCVLCEGLRCMHVCPDAALIPVPLSQVDMGTAMWREALCLRTSGEPCTICVDQCPIGSMAIAVVDNRIEVHDQGCTGCGVCEYNCPTSPKSIITIPKSARPPGD